MPNDTHQPAPTVPPLELPEQVSVALAGLAGTAREGLLALAVGTGLQVMHPDGGGRRYQVFVFTELLDQLTPDGTRFCWGWPRARPRTPSWCVTCWRG